MATAASGAIATCVPDDSKVAPLIYNDVIRQMIKQAPACWSKLSC
jgi:hypothetical protein